MSKIKDSHIKNTKLTINTTIIIISDSLSKLGDKWYENDKSGSLAKSLLNEYNHNIIKMTVVSDDIESIKEKIFKATSQNNSNFVLTIGGTGISVRDVTIEAVSPLLDKFLPGFGELFRNETNKQIGSISIMTRALAGVIQQNLICCLPGSPNAVKLGINLIQPEILHILNLRI